MTNQPTNYTHEYVDALKNLSPREIEVLDQVAEGYTSPEIADELYISKHTVQKHREIICRKLELRGFRSLFNWCKQYVM